MNNIEALRLADELLDGMSDEHWNQLNAEAAAELRRLHALNAELVEALAAEREECAKVCESEWSNVAERMYGEECAAAIRSRI